MLTLVVWSCRRWVSMGLHKQMSVTCKFSINISVSPGGGGGAGGHTTHSYLLAGLGVKLEFLHVCSASTSILQTCFAPMWIKSVFSLGQQGCPSGVGTHPASDRSA